MLRVLLIGCLFLLSFAASARVSGPLEVDQPKAVRDLPDIRRSGELRVLINQSRNSSGEVKGQSIGIEYQRLRAFEHQLNSNNRNSRTIKLKLIPKPKDQLLAALRRGEGDMVAPGELLSVPRGSNLSASAEVRKDVSLVIVARKGNRQYRHLEDLSGRSLALPTGSVAGDAIRELNQQLMDRKKAPLIIEWVNPTLAVEDVLEMVHAGIFNLTAVELPIAERWAKVMPKLRVDRHMRLLEDGSMHWYTRRDMPMLSASIDRFIKSYHPSADQDAVFQRVYRRLYKVHYPLGRVERQRLERVRPVLQRHAKAQNFDWLMLAALAFKESTLNPSARGAGGAMGLMQVTPAAARSVGVSNIANLDNNVMASAKYLAMIRRNFFNSPQLNERERMAFILAGYNLGPQRVQSMRAEARRRGLNPNQWFFQVERVAMEQIGMGVVSYVNSVNKYFVAFDRERYLLEPK
ncbi:transglycosylase SLT domain-containing protein [Pseudomonas sp. TTU2014-080ASC]|uniref:transglycosylase SLT domain-containing protein n=1 Tax=Pseudomonas sp. TTU2014-080ASC TaxID=1729724 RepID=UPI0007185C4C|nr:transglycosylase SLT domain-containing protein [Pseudomonas sp. TTU2014-080ASC]KRW59828.1 glycosylase [Pseudomonas sp. TTU2014-080ASC]